jgi:hypothetical protein
VDADAALEAIWQLKNVIESRELSAGTKITDVRTKFVKDTVSLRASLANHEAAPKPGRRLTWYERLLDEQLSNFAQGHVLLSHDGEKNLFLARCGNG